MKKMNHYIYPENSWSDGIWCYSFWSKPFIQFWVGIVTWFKLNPQRVCTFSVEACNWWE